LLVPDLRGYGDSDAPPAAEEYAIGVLAGDVLGLLDHADAAQGTVIGHDWGADVAWKTARTHPGRVRAVGGLSVPFAPRAPAPPLGLMREHLGADFYMVWFQEPGVAEAALERDVRRTLPTPRVWDAAWAADRDENPPTVAGATSNRASYRMERAGGSSIGTRPAESPCDLVRRSR
jgi:pimeloyl-ACP methyl ester carboxylesterase